MQKNAQIFAICVILLLMATPADSWGGRQDPPRSPDSRKERGAGKITLTSTRPTIRIPIDPANLAGPSPHLAIAVTRIANPNQVAFSIVVSLEPGSPPDEKSPAANQQTSSASQAIVLGILGVYPSDQPGRYQLDISSASQRLRASGNDLTRMYLGLTLKRLHPTQLAAGLEVVLSPPEWMQSAQ